MSYTYCLPFVLASMYEIVAVMTYPSDNISDSGTMPEFTQNYSQDEGHN